MTITRTLHHSSLVAPQNDQGSAGSLAPPVFRLHSAAGAGAGFSEGGEQFSGAGGHEIEVRTGHHELESLFLVFLDLLARAGRTAKELAVTFCRGDDLSDGFVQFWMRLAAAQSERKG